MEELDISKIEQKLSSEFLENYEVEKDEYKLTLTRIEESKYSSEPIKGESIKDDLGITIKGSHNLSFIISNDSKDKIFLVDSLKINWEYIPCNKITYLKDYYYDGPRSGGGDVGSKVESFEYFVNLTKETSIKLLSENSFKYSYGDVDKFKISVNIPGGFGSYRYWISFIHKIAGKDDSRLYRSELFEHTNCRSKIYIPIYDKKEYEKISRVESKIKSN